MESIDNTDKYYFFWQTSSPFSNWHFSQYILDDLQFNCSEQGVMYSKAILFGDIVVAKKILKCLPNQQKLMKSLGRQVKNFDENIWKKHRIQIYKRHCHAKFSQNQHLKNILISTGNKILVEASPSDKIWGIGLSAHIAKSTPVEKWKGLNLLGQILTEIKFQFMTE
mgnify:CR=1 FL=1